jgi:hypothetical protein
MAADNVAVEVEHSAQSLRGLCLFADPFASHLMEGMSSDRNPAWRARWRDPDSNRGHHDFQSCGGNSRTLPECLENTCSRVLSHPSRCTATPGGRDTARAGPKLEGTRPAIGNTQAVSLMSAPRQTPGSAWDRAPVPLRMRRPRVVSIALATGVFAERCLPSWGSDTFGMDLPLVVRTGAGPA